MHEFLHTHAALAPWIICFAILPAAFCLPISIDVLLVLAVILGTTVMPESLIHLYIGFVAGCIGAAWIAYWIGRILGTRVSSLPFIGKHLHLERLEKMNAFYRRFGTITLVVGRFIPFGIRNLIFYSSGISRMSFAKFAIVDTLACLVWSSLFFTAFVMMAENFESLLIHMKRTNLVIFGSFGVALIGLIWYKYRKFNKSR